MQEVGGSNPLRSTKFSFSACSKNLL